MNTPPDVPSPYARYGWAWLPIPLLLALIAGLWVADLQTVYESRVLVVLLHLLFTGLASLSICVLTARGFLDTGQPGLLMFGCGSLLWGVTSLAAAAIVDRMNPAITGHNLGVLAAALCHVAGLWWRRRLARPAPWLAAGYATALALSALIFWAAMAGWTPPFFVQGQGGTLVRQAVLALAVLLFAWVAWQMLARFQRQVGDFYYWYGLGLALTATGLTGVFLLTVQGGLLSWTNRLTLYLGGAYLFGAAMVAVREAGSWRISLAAMEEAWQRGELLPTPHQGPMLRLTLRYGLAVGIVAAALALRQALTAWVGPGLPTYITFYPAVAVVALMTGWGPTLLATTLTSGVAAYWFLSPVGQFTIASPVDRLALLIFIGMDVFMAAVAELYRRNRQKVADYERKEALRESQEALRRSAELIDPIRAELIAQEMLRVVRERGATAAVPPEPLGATLRRVPVGAGAVVAAGGLLVLSGWLFGVDAFKSVLPGLVTMKANTALCFLLAGVALMLHARRAVRMACAGVVCAVAGLTLAEYVTGADFGIDQLWFRDAPSPHTIFPGRMVEATALGFLLSAVSLLLLGVKSQSGGRVQQGLAVATAVIGMVAVLGYAYDVRQLYRFAGYSSMALHTAASFLLLAAGLILARGDGLGAVLMTPGPGAQLARRLLPAVLLVPTVLGWLCERGLHLGFYGAGMNVAMITLVMMLSLSALVLWTTFALNRTDEARRETETRLRNTVEVMDHAFEPLIVRELGGVIHSWNHGAEALYGWSAVEAVGRHQHVLLRTEGITVEELDRQLATTGHWEGELIHTTAVGRRVTVESRQTATHTPGGLLLILESNRDISARRQAEQAVQQSEERFRLMGDTIPYGAWMTDAEGHNTYISPLFLDLVGMTFEQVKEFGWTDKMPPEDVEPTMRRWMECVRTGRDWEGELRFPSSDGRWHTILSRGKPVRDTQGQIKAWVGINLDITAIKETELALRRSAAELQLILDSSPALIFYKDRENRFQQVNRAFAESMGMSAEALVGRSNFDLYPRAQAEAYQKNDREVIATGQPKLGIIEPMPTSAGVRWLQTDKVPSRDAAGNIIGVIGFATDITERKAAEEALQASESFYRQTLESIPGMVFTTRPDGYCDYQSQQWVDYTGVPMVEHLGDGWNKLQHPDDRPRSYAAWSAAVQGHDPYDLEYRVRRHDGVYEWFKVIGRPICDASGQIARWFGVAMNIQGIKDAEEAAQASLAEKEVLLKEIHHRVKNNMQVISSLVDLQADALDNPELTGIFEDIRDRVRSMALVHEKLYCSDNLLSIDFAEYANGLLDYLWRAHKNSADNVTLTLNLDPLFLSVDTAVPCGLILNELAINAVKHAFTGRSNNELVVTLSSHPDGGVCLRVSDNGVGLPAGMDWQQSTSLGLNLVRMLAKQLKAQVEVQGANGTEFRISFKPPEVKRGIQAS